MIPQLMSDELDYLNGFEQGQTHTVEACDCQFGRWLKHCALCQARVEELDMLHRQFHELIEMSARLAQFGEHAAAAEHLSLAYLLYSRLFSLALETEV